MGAKKKLQNGFYGGAAGYGAENMAPGKNHRMDKEENQNGQPGIKTRSMIIAMGAKTHLDACMERWSGNNLSISRQWRTDKS